MLNKHKYLILLVIWLGIITYLGLFSLNDAPKVRIPNFDKYVHFVFHLVHTSLWFLFLKFEYKHPYIKHILVLAAVIDFTYGCLIEVLQGLFTTTRHADILDVVFNTFGTIVAVLLMKLIIKKTVR